MINSLRGKHYPLRLYADGRKTRSKFLYLDTAARAAVKRLLSARRGKTHTVEVLRVKDERPVVIATRTRGRTITITWGRA